MLENLPFDEEFLQPLLITYCNQMHWILLQTQSNQKLTISYSSLNDNYISVLMNTNVCSYTVYTVNLKWPKFKIISHPFNIIIIMKHKYSFITNQAMMQCVGVLCVFLACRRSGTNYVYIYKVSHNHFINFCSHHCFTVDNLNCVAGIRSYSTYGSPHFLQQPTSILRCIFAPVVSKKSASLACHQL